MKLALAFTMTAALILGGCNSNERSRDRDRDRSERSERDADRNSSRSRDSDRSRAEDRRSDERTSSGAITEAFLTGRWADSRDCRASPVVFESNGEFEANGGGRGRWSIENGNTIVMEAAGRRQTLEVEKVSEDEIRVTSNGASSYRCD